MQGHAARQGRPDGLQQTQADRPLTAQADRREAFIKHCRAIHVRRSPWPRRSNTGLGTARLLLLFPRARRRRSIIRKPRHVDGMVVTPPIAIEGIGQCASIGTRCCARAQSAGPTGHSVISGRGTDTTACTTRKRKGRKTFPPTCISRCSARHSPHIVCQLPATMRGGLSGTSVSQASHRRDCTSTPFAD